MNTEFVRAALKSLSFAYFCNNLKASRVEKNLEVQFSKKNPLYSSLIIPMKLHVICIYEEFVGTENSSSMCIFIKIEIH